MNVHPLSEKSVSFRMSLIDALGRDSFVYITEDVFVGRCPLCRAPVGVRFHGYAPRATLCCHGGCSEREIAEQLNLPNVEAVP